MPCCYHIIWLDANSADPLSSFRNKLGDVQPFTDADKCIEYIQSHLHEHIYLIISGSLAKETVPKVYESPNLVQIFLFCGSVATYVEWALDYCDKMMIFDHGDDLLERLWNELQIQYTKQASLCLQHAEELRQRALEYKKTCG